MDPRALGLLLGGALLVGCSTGSGGPPSPTGTAPGAQVVARPVAGTTLHPAPRGGAEVLRSLPPRLARRLVIVANHGARAAFTRREVLRSLDGSRDNVPGTPPVTVALRRVTDRQYGPVDASGAVRDPLIEDRLAWVVADTDARVCPASGGPMNAPGEPRVVLRCGVGGVVTLLDARDGAFLAGYQF